MSWMLCSVYASSCLGYLALHAMHADASVAGFVCSLVDIGLGILNVMRTEEQGTLLAWDGCR